MTLARLLPLVLLAACTGGDSNDDTGGSDTDTDTDTDTAGEPTPVWGEYRVGTSSTLQGVYASGDGVYVVGTEAGAFVGGANVSWDPLAPGLEDEDFTDLWGQGSADSLELVVTATSGNIAHYSGGAWEQEDLGTADHQGVGGSSSEAIYAVSWGPVYAFDGATWTSESTPGGERLNEVWGVGADAFAVGEAGAIVRRDSTGAWTAMTSGVDVDLAGVAGTAINDVWAVGADGTALHYDGTAWTATETGVDEALWAVFAPESTAVYAVGNNGTAIVWDGSEWTALPTGVTNNLYAIHGASAANVWAVGNRGTALQYKAD